MELRRQKQGRKGRSKGEEGWREKGGGKDRAREEEKEKAGESEMEEENEWNELVEGGKR